MTVNDALAKPDSLGDEAVRAQRRARLIILSPVRFSHLRELPGLD